MVSGLLFSALSSRPGFSVLSCWLLSGETPVSGTHASRGKVRHTWSFRTQSYSDPSPSSSSYLPGPTHLHRSHIAPELLTPGNISKGQLGWKQFTMATTYFPGVYPSVPGPKAATGQSSAWGSLNTQLLEGSSALKELQAPTQGEPGLPPRLCSHFAELQTGKDKAAPFHAETDRQTDGWQGRAGEIQPAKFSACQQLAP